MDTLVYGLFDPENGELRYVGKPTTGLKRPRAQHNRALKGREGAGHKSNWIRSLACRGLRYDIQVIQRVNAAELARAEMYWIRFFRDQGCRLTNCTAGGEGQWGVVFPAERRLKIARSHGARPFADENGNLYESVRAAARALGTYHNMISQVLLGRRKSIHGHTFKYVE
jgi:hypothetical protein